jgi:DtxR family transcriptional regulator, Mn-dependent transcriptional regulator
MLSFTEENYLKAIYHLSLEGEKAVSTNAIADNMQTRAASVTDMIKKLSAKDVITYEKYYGVKITKKGREAALLVIRKHRLWETFLVNKLGFSWDEVHDVAEQLEHIHSPLLITKLDEFLGFPKFDPHGDPIPDDRGKLSTIKQVPLSEAIENKKYEISGVKDDNSAFLRYLDKIGIYIGASIKIQERIEFDGSLEIQIDNRNRAFVSKEAAQNILLIE